MKYLKKYKTFENSQFDDISDILLELEDIGFSIQKDSYDCKKITNKLCNDVIEITISKNKHYMRYGGRTSGFKYSEIEDTVDRLVDYMTESGWLFDITAGRNVKGGYRIIDFNNVKPKASIIFCRLHFYRTIDHYIKESNNYSDVLFPNQDLIEEYEIKDFFYDYLDDATFEENFQLDYYSNLYFLREYLNNKLIEDLEYVMQYSDDWEEAVYGHILYKDLFIDITSVGMVPPCKEQIIVKPGPNFRDIKLSNLDKLILDNSKKGIIPYYLTMSLSFGRFSPKRYHILLECLSRFYESSGWRPFDGIWTEDYLGDNNEIYESYGASLKLFNGSDEEYKKLCEISVFGKSPNHPQRKLLKKFI